MKIKFWGCRGGIPVPDNRMMRFGGNTCCVEVNLGGSEFIIDAGTGIRKLGEELIKRGELDLDLFITHSHWDHIQGFPFFNPIFMEESKINIHGYSRSSKCLKDLLKHQMSQEYFPVSFLELKSQIAFLEENHLEFEINNRTIKVIQTNHPMFTLGLRIEEGDKSFVFLTDNELNKVNPATKKEAFVEFCCGATLLVHDAEFTEKEYERRQGWGHSTYSQVIDLANKAEVESLGFFHHNANREDDALARIERDLTKSCRAEGYDFNLFAVRELYEIEI